MDAILSGPYGLATMDRGKRINITRRKVDKRLKVGAPTLALSVKERQQTWHTKRQVAIRSGIHGLVMIVEEISRSRQKTGKILSKLGDGLRRATCTDVLASPNQPIQQIRIADTIGGRQYYLATITRNGADNSRRPARDAKIG